MLEEVEVNEGAGVDIKIRERIAVAQDTYNELEHTQQRLANVAALTRSFVATGLHYAQEAQRWLDGSLSLFSALSGPYSESISRFHHAFLAIESERTALLHLMRHLLADRLDELALRCSPPALHCLSSQRANRSAVTPEPQEPSLPTSLPTRTSTRSPSPRGLFSRAIDASLRKFDIVPRAPSDKDGAHQPGRLSSSPGTSTKKSASQELIGRPPISGQSTTPRRSADDKAATERGFARTLSPRKHGHTVRAGVGSGVPADPSSSERQAATRVLLTARERASDALCGERGGAGARTPSHTIAPIFPFREHEARRQPQVGAGREADAGRAVSECEPGRMTDKGSCGDPFLPLHHTTDHPDLTGPAFSGIDLPLRLRRQMSAHHDTGGAEKEPLIASVPNQGVPRKRRSSSNPFPGTLEQQHWNALPSVATPDVWELHRTMTRMVLTWQAGKARELCAGLLGEFKCQATQISSRGEIYSPGRQSNDTPQAERFRERFDREYIPTSQSPPKSPTGSSPPARLPSPFRRIKKKLTRAEPTRDDTPPASADVEAALLRFTRGAARLTQFTEESATEGFAMFAHAALQFVRSCHGLTQDLSPAVQAILQDPTRLSPSQPTVYSRWRVSTHVQRDRIFATRHQGFLLLYLPALPPGLAAQVKAGERGTKGWLVRWGVFQESTLALYRSAASFEQLAAIRAADCTMCSPAGFDEISRIPNVSARAARKIARVSAPITALVIPGGALFACSATCDDVALWRTAFRQGGIRPLRLAAVAPSVKSATIPQVFDPLASKDVVFADYHPHDVSVEMADAMACLNERESDSFESVCLESDHTASQEAQQQRTRAGLQTLTRGMHSLRKKVNLGIRDLDTGAAADMTATPRPHAGATQNRKRHKSMTWPTPRLENLHSQLEGIYADNDCCADCGAAEPAWYLPMHGTVVCEHCRDAHVSATCCTTEQPIIFPPDKSSQYQALSSLGNRVVNRVLEARLESKWVFEGQERTRRLEFVQRKYILLDWAAFEDPSWSFSPKGATHMWVVSGGAAGSSLGTPMQRSGVHRLPPQPTGTPSPWHIHTRQTLPDHDVPPSSSLATRSHTPPGQSTRITYRPPTPFPNYADCRVASTTPPPFRPAHARPAAHTTTALAATPAATATHTAHNTPSSPLLTPPPQQPWEQSLHRRPPNTSATQTAHHTPSPPHPTTTLGTPQTQQPGIGTPQNLQPGIGTPQTQQPGKGTPQTLQAGSGTPFTPPTPAPPAGQPPPPRPHALLLAAARRMPPAHAAARCPAPASAFFLQCRQHREWLNKHMPHDPM